MTIQDLWLQSQKFLDRSSFKELMVYCLKKDNFKLTEIVASKQAKKYFAYLKKIKKGMPLAYVINNKYFFENDFFVNKNVLIPRFDSELLVEELLKYDLKNKNVLDLCCGSGCLGLSVKLKEPTISLTLSDLSSKALKVCKKNISKHKLEAKIICANFLEVFNKINERVDFLIINPPYIDESDPLVDENTKKFEPHMALYAKDNGLYFYEELFKSIDNLNLNNNAVVICEFGFQQQNEINLLFKKYVQTFLIEFKKDYNNNPRFFVMQKR